MDEPLVEHPAGEFENAVDAMADAIRRLRKLPKWNHWITFCAQGMGSRVDSYHFAEIPLRRDVIDVNALLTPEAVAREAGVSDHCFEQLGAAYSVLKASPEEAAKLFDVIFRQHLGIHPHDDEGEDYTVVAEWVAG